MTLAIARYKQIVRSAFREVADTLSTRHWLAEQLAVAQSALMVQTERARLSQLRFANSASAFLDVLDGQRDLPWAEQQSVQIRPTLLTSPVNLYAALCGEAIDHVPLPVESPLRGCEKIS